MARGLNADVPIGPTANWGPPNAHLDADHDAPRRARGALAGAIGGLVGAWAMTRFAEAWVAAFEPGGRNEDRAATEELVQHLAVGAMSRGLTRRELAAAAPAAHYALGAAMGAAYGAAVELAPVNAAGGAAWGLLVWAATGALGAWMLGFSTPTDMPGMSTQGFAAHVTFGVTNEVVRKGVRALL